MFYTNIFLASQLSLLALSLMANAYRLFCIQICGFEVYHMDIPVVLAYNGKNYLVGSYFAYVSKCVVKINSVDLIVSSCNQLNFIFIHLTITISFDFADIVRQDDINSGG